MADPFLTRTEAVAYLGIEPGETAAIALMPGLVGDATSALIDVMGGDPRATDYAEWRDGTGGPAQPVRYGPITRVSRVLVDGNADELSGITWDDTLVYRRGRWPRGQRNVRIFYTAGLDELPGAIRQAALHTLNAMWGARRLDMNATGESFAGVLSQSFWQTGPGVVPPSARDLVRPYTSRYFG